MVGVLGGRGMENERTRRKTKGFGRKKKNGG